MKGKQNRATQKPMKAWRRSVFPRNAYLPNLYSLLFQGIRILALAACVLLSGCAQYETVKNGCVVDAVVKQAVYKQQHNLEAWYWSKVLIVKWSNNRSPNSHALCMYVFKDHLMAYDYWNGSREVPIAYRQSPESIAHFLYGQQVGQASYLEDTPSISAVAGSSESVSVGKAQ